MEFAAGSPALDLVDTISGRGRDEIDLVPTPASFGEWVEKAGLLPADAAAFNIGHLRRACELRAATYRCASAALAGEAFPAADVAVINQLAALPGFRPQLAGARRIARARNPQNAILSLLARDAIEILTQHRARLRTCPGCNMLFIDKSLPGRRRWCSSSAGCGNLAKVRNFRSRQTAGKGGSA